MITEGATIATDDDQLQIVNIDRSMNTKYGFRTID